MSVVKVLELVAWLVLVGAIVAMCVRAVWRNDSREAKRRTGRMLAWSMAVSGPLLALVYGLESLDLADALIDSGRRGASEPWFPAVLGVVLTAMAPGALRRTRRR